MDVVIDYNKNFKDLRRYLPPKSDSLFIQQLLIFFQNSWLVTQNTLKILQTSVQDALKDGAPNGVDCFFDNVGGEDAAVIINSMNEFGRVSCCGAISVYNESEKALPKISTTSQTIVFRVSIFHLDCKYMIRADSCKTE